MATQQFTSAATFIEGELDSIHDYRVEAMVNYAKDIFRRKKEELQNSPFVNGLAKPTQQQIDNELKQYDPFNFEPTPSTLFNDAVNDILKEQGYDYEKGIPGILIIYNVDKKDVGPGNYVANRATVVVTFSEKELENYRLHLEKNNNMAALSILN